ncbi:expressed unknown protein [Seminavis robusta]|uniref:Uncharacterized protein n=1 Tax=Seminavis robusta TaxID=568900 RepID=A0A9N8EG24_9STRA|nr:expressed unknown protein [Seminavis robusta]|eukprot:Sro883_g215440.1 n/a (183) ;mRNA; f:7412-7960
MNVSIRSSPSKQQLGFPSNRRGGQNVWLQDGFSPPHRHHIWQKSTGSHKMKQASFCINSARPPLQQTSTPMSTPPTAEAKCQEWFCAIVEQLGIPFLYDGNVNGRAYLRTTGLIEGLTAIREQYLHFKQNGHAQNKQQALGLLVRKIQFNFFLTLEETGYIAGCTLHPSHYLKHSDIVTLYG